MAVWSDAYTATFRRERITRICLHPLQRTSRVGGPYSPAITRYWISSEPEGETVQRTSSRG